MVSLSSRLPFFRPRNHLKNIFFYAVAGMKWWSGTKKMLQNFRHSVSFFYGGLYTTKSFLIDGRLVLLGNSETLKRIKGKVMPSENSIFTFMVLIRKKKSWKIFISSTFYREEKKKAKVAKTHTLRSKEGFKADHFFKDSNWEKNLFTA